MNITIAKQAMEAFEAALPQGFRINNKKPLEKEVEGSPCMTVWAMNKKEGISLLFVWTGSRVRILSAEEVALCCKNLKKATKGGAQKKKAPNWLSAR